MTAPPKTATYLATFTQTVALGPASSGLRLKVSPRSVGYQVMRNQLAKPAMATMMSSRHMARREKRLRMTSMKLKLSSCAAVGSAAGLSSAFGASSKGAAGAAVPCGSCRKRMTMSA